MEQQETYTWGLPGGDLSVDAIGDVFNSLVAGDCATASTDLEVFLVNDNVWTQGQEQLYRAAIAACSGDVQGARGFLRVASLTRHPGDCRLYRAIITVIEQRAQESVVCPSPEAIGQPTPDEGTPAGSPDTTPSDSTDPAVAPEAQPSGSLDAPTPAEAQDASFAVTPSNGADGRG